MKRTSDRSDTAILIAWLRELRGWDQSELARRAGLTKSQISDYERGKEPSAESQAKILAAVNLPAAWAESLTQVIRHYRELAAREKPLVHDGKMAETLTAAVLEHIAAIGPSLFAELDLLLEPPPPSIEEQRGAAEERFERLAALTEEERRVLVDFSPRFQDWALIERLCTESREAAATSPREAKGWADLALRAARAGSEGDEVSRKRLEAYSLAHCANVRRLANDPEGAREDFRKAWQLWGEEQEGQEDRILDVAWMVHLENALH